MTDTNKKLSDEALSIKETISISLDYDVNKTLIADTNRYLTNASFDSKIELINSLNNHFAKTLSKHLRDKKVKYLSESIINRDIVEAVAVEKNILSEKNKS